MKCEETNLKKMASRSVTVKAGLHCVITKVQMKKKTMGLRSIIPYRRANLFAEIVVTMVIKVINSAHDQGGERGVMCSCDCTFTKVLLVAQRTDSVP